MVFDSLAAPGGYKRSAGEPSLTLLVHFFSLVRLRLPPGIIRCRCQPHGEFKEVVRLAGEKLVGRPGLDGGHCTSQLGGGRPNHRTGRQGFFEWKSHGSGRILLVWVSSSCRWRRAKVAGSFRSGNVAPLGFFGSITPAKVGLSHYPPCHAKAKSGQSRLRQCLAKFAEPHHWSP